MDAGAGSPVRAYEEAFARRCGRERGIAFGHARTALAVACAAAGLRPGDEVALSPLTCKVVPLALLSAGMRLRYVDIDATTLNLDPGVLENRITDATRAVLFQWTYGLGGGADETARVAAAHGLLMIDDLAHCLPGPVPGASGGGSPRRIGIYSNNAGKPLPAGAGGMLVTDDPVIAARSMEARDGLRLPSGTAGVVRRVDVFVRNRWLTPRLYWPALQFAESMSSYYRERPLPREIESHVRNVAARISDGQARSGLRWLARSDELAGHRRQCCEHYRTLLEGSRGRSIDGSEGALYLYPVLVAGKQRLLQRARRASIEMVAWPPSTPIHPVREMRDLEKYGYRAGSCPVAESVAQELVGLPTHMQVAKRHRRALAALVRSHV